SRSISTSLNKVLKPEYDLNAKWDACLDLSVRHFVSAFAVGAFTGLLLFRSLATRWASVAFGAGIVHHQFENNMHLSQQHSLLHIVPQAFQGQPTTCTTVIDSHPPSICPRVKVLSINRLGGAGAVVQLVFDVSLQSVKEDANENGYNQPAWENWSNDDIEREVVKLMEEDVGAAMQFLQSKVLCIMPISLASLIYPTQQPDTSSLVKPEPFAPS
nr:transcription factor UNE12 [Tanacetum cinerariifolium]